MRGILDTSTLILLGRIEDPSTLPTEPVITAITLAELSAGPLVAAHDAMIAAIALANGLPVHTCNPRDFDGISGLDVIAVPRPGT